MPPKSYQDFVVFYKFEKFCVFVIKSDLMSLAEILQAVEKLSSSERAKVAEALAYPTADNSISERQSEMHWRMLEKGLLKGIPDLGNRDRNFKPIKIKGKPLSETIIEERR